MADGSPGLFLGILQLRGCGGHGSHQDGASHYGGPHVPLQVGAVVRGPLAYGEPQPARHRSGRPLGFQAPAQDGRGGEGVAAGAAILWGYSILKWGTKRSLAHRRERKELTEAPDRPLLSERYAGVVDTVSGVMLARALAQVKYGGAAMVKEELEETFAQDITLLAKVGIKVVIVIADGHYGRAEDAQMGICHLLCYAFMENPAWGGRAP